MIDINILRENIIRICKGEVGTCEEPKGSNKTKYGKWFGFNGVAWCCIAICWVFDSAGARLKGITKNDRGFAHTQNIIDFANKHKLWTTTPKRGDIALLEFKKGGYIDHIGIVEFFEEKNKTVDLFEGNTSSDDSGSQDNGDGFYPKKRDKKWIYGYIDTEKLIKTIYS